MEGEARRLDRFELVAELAAGGMATVYLARLSGVGGFQRFVAIKRLHPHLARDEDFIEMFLDEARLAARIHHPNVVPILEIGTSDEGYYLVMEYIEGDTLGRLLARSVQSGAKLPPGIGIRIVLDALAGLHAAHELKDDDGKPLECVHRDVSPQNILVGVDGASRITDFGVARAATRLSTTRTGQLKGKLAYMAPEQAKGAADIDRRADIFAMGTVLWEVLACKRLFKGDGDAETLNKVLHEPIPALRTVAPAMPVALDTICAKALDRDRSKRFANAAEFADALERAARVVGMLGAHRDVSAHVDIAIGTEISQQRDAVRAWLARSEPSSQGIVGPNSASMRRESGIDTRVESAARRAEVSQPSSVSGVSSAVGDAPIVSSTSVPIVMPLASPPSAPAAGVAPQKASRGWIAVAVLMILGGAGFVANKRWPELLAPPAAATPPATIAPVVSAPTTPTPVIAPTTSAPPAASSPADSRADSRPIASAAPASSDSGTSSRRKPTAPPPYVRPATPPAATAAPTAAVPDDISRNPYR